MPNNIEELKIEFERRQPYVSGATIIEIFGKAACESWEGASALIDAYLELEQSTGEYPKKAYINDELYLVLKGYWSKNIGEDIIKLDKFLGMVKG